MPLKILRDSTEIQNIDLCIPENGCAYNIKEKLDFDSINLFYKKCLEQAKELNAKTISIKLFRL